MQNRRILNAVFWAYIWLSQILLPVVTTGDDFWALKARQLVTFGPFDDMPRFLGRAFIPLILWALIDWRLRRKAAAKKI
jgi:hypothetical protein